MNIFHLLINAGYIEKENKIHDRMYGILAGGCVSIRSECILVKFRTPVFW